MPKKPLLILFATFLFFFFPIEWWLQAVEERLSFYRAASMDPLGFILSVVLPLILMVGLARVTRFGWYSLICFAVVWGARDVHSLALSEGEGAFAVIGHLGIFLFSLFYFINPRVKTLYFDPKLQWWKTKTRFATHLPALCFDGTAWHYPILSNISEGGCFLETAHPLKVDQGVTLAIPLSEPLGVSVIRAQGEVRWTSNHPLKSGMGIQFTEVRPAHQRAIQDVVRENL